MSVQELPEAAQLPDLSFAQSLREAGLYDWARTFLEDKLREWPGQPQVLLEQGRLCAAQGRYAEAITHYRASVERAPDEPAGHLALGDALLAQQEYAAAEEAYGQAAQRLDNPAEAYLGQGKACYAQQQYDRALGLFQRALALGPESADLHNNLGLTYEARGQYELALTHYQRVSALAPDSATGPLNCGDAYIGLGRYDEALRAYLDATRLLERAGNPALGYWKQGGLYAAQQQYDKARERYRLALDWEPQNPEYYNSMGLAYEAQGQYGLALKHYQRAAALAPDNPTGHLNCGDAYSGLQRYDEALKAYAKASELLEQAGSPAFGYWKQGELYAARQQYDRALSLYQRALELDPQSPEYLASLGALYAAQRQHAQALELYRRVAELRPESPSAYLSCGDAYVGLGRYDEALEAYAAAARQSPELALAYWKQGDVHYTREEYERALAAYQAALQHAPESTELLFSTGQAHERLAERAQLDGQPAERAQQYERAIACYQRIAQLNPNSPIGPGQCGDVCVALQRYDEALRLYGRAIRLLEKAGNPAFGYLKQGGVYSLLQQYDKARESYRRALDFDPQSADAHNSLGVIHESRRRYEAALQHYLQAAALAPDEPTGHLNCGDAYIGLGRYDEALKAYRRATVRLEKTGNPAFGYWKQGNVYVIQQQYPKARRLYQRALGHDPENADMRYSHGQVIEQLAEEQRRQGDEDAAMAQLRQALQEYDRFVALAADNPVAFSTRARVNLALQRYSQALLDYAEAERLATSDADRAAACWGQAQVLFEQELYAEAGAAATRAAALQPENAQYHQTLALATYYQRDYSSALQSYQAAARLAEASQDIGQLVEALYGQALCLYMRSGRDDYAELLRVMRRAVRLSPYDTRLLGFYGDALSEIAEYRQAARVLRQGLEVDEQNELLLASLGWALENIGPRRAAAACEAYRGAIKLNEENLWARKGLANGLRLMGKHAEADGEYRYVIEHAQPDADPALLGWCYYSLRMYAEAAGAYTKALELEPAECASTFDMGLCQLCAGEVEQAGARYEQGVAQAMAQPVEKARGRLFVACTDLQEALELLPDLARSAAAQAIAGRLGAAQAELEEQYRARRARPTKGRA